jgi:hypothetical protein
MANGGKFQLCNASGTHIAALQAQIKAPDLTPDLIWIPDLVPIYLRLQSGNVSS